MQKEKKSGIISALSDRLTENEFVVSTTYQGISAQSLASLRWTLVASGVKYHVVKNTLVRLAAEESQREQVMDIIDGCTALGFATDAVEAAKVLRQHARGKDALIEIRGGLLGKKVLTAQQVLALADLPPREVLIAQLASQLLAPISKLHRALSWPLQGLHNVLQARIEQVAQ